MNIVYARVSKEEEKTQDIEAQIKAIFEKFNLKTEDTFIFKERGSAYDLDKMHKRTEFLTLIDTLFCKKTTIEDLFKKQLIKEEVNLYIWDYSRLMRNMEYCLLFSILACLYDVKIYSCKNGLMSADAKETPSIKLSKYLLSSIHSYSGEEYSYNISKNVKKAVNHDKKITVSKDGKKWGRQLVDLDGNNIEVKQIQKINKYILTLIEDYEQSGKKGYYSKIIKYISNKFNVKVSKSYITNVKNIYIRV